MTEYKVEHVLRCYDKSTDRLASEHNLDHIPLEKLRLIVNPTADDPLMYFVYNCDAAKAERLKDFVKIDFDFQQYDYHFDCDRIY